jgi:hypothetical protein
LVCCGHTSEHLVALFAGNIARHAHARGVKPKVRPAGITFANPTSVRSVYLTSVTCSCLHPPRQYRHFTHEQRCSQVDSPNVSTGISLTRAIQYPTTPTQTGGVNEAPHTSRSPGVIRSDSPTPVWAFHPARYPTTPTQTRSVNGTPHTTTRVEAPVSSGLMGISPSTIPHDTHSDEKCQWDSTYDDTSRSPGVIRSDSPTPVWAFHPARYPTLHTRNGGVKGAPPRPARTPASSGSAR